jgi:hypothetical protein
LIAVTAVARVLSWDGRRLLRFLAGLAMVALAFTTPASAPAAGVAEPAAPVAVVTPVAVDQAAVSSAPAAVTPHDAGLPVAAVWPAVPAQVTRHLAAAGLLVLAGIAVREWAGRAPPLA